ncbi:hypothetical protein [Vibrio parahaemolyticus]|uniref:hypothetical protein n=1 Tax=Vibrio parahaemolyticus TaxID=670 RepID=UPI00226B60DB|nr:hypothetical protein [Vibrio parahaemolyticus]MCX8941277.1 hypothetical protein [Vibrio parahaemolyticus]
MGKKIEAIIMIPQDGRMMEKTKQMSDQDRYKAMQDQTGRMKPSQLRDQPDSRQYKNIDEFHRAMQNRGKDYDPMRVHKAQMADWN